MLSRLFLIIFLFQSTLACGVNLKHRKFNHITKEEGLSQAGVFSIYKDSHGYYWFGTGNGLNRYDGYGMKIYLPDEANENSISGRSVLDIHEDSQGRLWMISSTQLNRYDPKTEYFKHFSKEDGLTGPVYDIDIDGENLWVLTNEKLYRLNTRKLEIEFELKLTSVTLDILATEDKVWLSSYQGLWRYDIASGQISRYGFPVEYGHSSKQVSILSMHLRKDYLWLGTRYGVVAFNIKKRRYEVDSHRLPGKQILSISEDSLGRLWLGSQSSGVYVYAPETDHMSHINTDSNDHYGLLENLANEFHIIEDELWICSSKGASYMRLNPSVGFIRAGNSKLLDNQVYSISADSKGRLWIGTSRGVTRIDQDKGQTKTYLIDRASDFYFTRSDLWVVSNAGVFKYDSNLDQFISQNDRIPTLHARNTKSVDDIWELETGRFLLATGYHAILWDSVSETSEPIALKGNDNPLGFYAARHIFKVDKDILLTGNEGFMVYKPDTKTVEKFKVLPADSKLNNTVIEDVDIIDNSLWVSSYEGLFRVKDGKVLARYTKEDGLPDTIVRFTVVDDGVLWVASDFGMSAFKTENDRLQKIYINDSQIGVEFNGGGRGIDYFDRKKGLVYLPSMEGVVYFDPKTFSNILPKTTITGLHLFNQAVTPGGEFLSQSITYTKELVLNYNQNMLTFEFSSLNLRDPDHLYAYQLEGLSAQNTWITTTADNRRATFTPGPGEYTFRVKSGWDQKTWSDDIAEVSVTILPPWWQTSWAYTIYIALLLISLFVFIRYRTIALAKRAEELEYIVDERTEQLKISHEQVEQLLEHKNILFANTSHELRTPLTLILGPIEEVLKSCSAEHKQTLELAKRNTERLIHMVDQLLELARISSPTQDEFSNANFSEILHTVIRSIQGLLEERSIRLFEHIEEDVIIPALPDALDVIILNLLSNAIKYTEDGGEVTVNLEKRFNQSVTYSVKDSGIGIAKSEQKLVFEKFTRLNQARNRAIPGSGIGLALVKELVELHGGTIELVSEEGKGSIFSVTLPLAQLESTSDVQITQPSKQKLESFQAATQGITDGGDIETPGEPLLPDLENRPKLLIIDDTADMLNYLQQLTAPFYHCILADNGETGLEYAEQQLPDLMLCDVMMPGIDGFEVLRGIRDNIQTSHIPLILLTAKGDKLSRIKGYHAQVDDYIAKPFDAEELLVRMHSLLQRRQSLRESLQKKFEQGDLTLDAPNSNLSEKDLSFLKSFQLLVEQHHSEREYKIIDLAKALYLSERSLQVKLKSLAGYSPLAYLNRYRLEQACKYLKETDLPIQIIIEKVGFSDGPNFTRMFKKHYGKSPRKYRS